MSFLLDTNAVSEWSKPRPDPGFIQWLHEADEDRLFLSVLTLGEVRSGVDRLDAGTRRNRLERWLEHDLAPRFEGRILPVDADVADSWGRIVAGTERTGRPMKTVDALLAATARHHRLTLVTRNTGDFAAAGIELLNPWSG
ncbi:MAG TPA: type II toxin-antitoxin system VapC family toxin [Myxococcaceae bacterium]|nr:type II toxin-antitoxin system VapC family toxin [Myxococcaceae bacterium]